MVGMGKKRTNIFAVKKRVKISLRMKKKHEYEIVNVIKNGG